MKIRTLLIIAGAILIIVFGLYIQQGGLRKVEIKEVTSTSRFMIGKSYEGNVGHKDFSVMFHEIKNLKQNENIEGDLATIFYNDPKENKGDIKAFFGVINSKKPKLVAGYEIKEIIKDRYLQGSINASTAFVNKTYNAIFDYAEENNIELEQEYLEWFPSENEIMVQVKINE